ncbi:hypothetical protein EON64_02790 [archaeon]|nr:MAG: hypothetical protein EON64_02790 [archaeon]
MLYALAFLSLMHTLVCYHAVLSSSISIPRVYSAFQVNEALSEALSSNASTAIGLLVDSGASPGLQKALQDTLSRSTSATQVALVRAESLADVQQAFQLVDLADFSVLYLPRTQRLHENRVLQLAERLLAGSAKVAVLLDGDDVHCRQLESRVRALVLPQRPQQPADQVWPLTMQYAHHLALTLFACSFL